MKNADHRQGYTMVNYVCLLFCIIPLCIAVIDQRERTPDYDLLAEEFLRENRQALPEDRDHDIPSTVESLVDVETEVTMPTPLPPYWVTLFNATIHEETHDLPTTERSTTEEEQNINIEDDDDTDVTEVTTDDTSVTTDVTSEAEVTLYGTTDTEADASDTTTERTVSVEVPVDVDADSAHVPLTVKVILTIHNKSETTSGLETTTDYLPTELVKSETTTVDSDRDQNHTTTADDQDDTDTTTETVLDDAVISNGTVQVSITAVLINATEVLNLTEPGLESENVTGVTVIYNATIAISADLSLNASSGNVTAETLDDSVEKVTTTQETETTETTTEDTTLAETEGTMTPETVDSTIFLIPVTSQPYWKPTTSEPEPDESTVHPLKVFEQFVHLYSLIIFALALIFIVVLCCMYGACCSETGRVTTTREVQMDKNYPLDNMKGRSLKGADEPLLTQI